MNSTHDCNLLVAGVGGQGSVLIGNILGNAVIDDGLQVWVGETFGMSQRGGSVVSHVRISNEMVSPITPQGTAGVLLGLEPMETLRVAQKYLKLGGKIIYNPRQVLPSDVISGLSSYPPVGRIFAALEQIGGEVIQIDAGRLAEQTGNTMTVNIVMLGALAASGTLPISFSAIEAAVKAGVPPKTVAVNLKAFHLGAGALTKTEA
jgi:indolepyruvate ferredoxin oxidoreductase, beta subunit